MQGKTAKANREHNAAHAAHNAAAEAAKASGTQQAPKVPAGTPAQAGDAPTSKLNAEQNVLRAKMLSRTTPKAKSLDAANAAVLDAIRIVARQEAELQSTGVATLALAVRDDLYWLVKAGTIQPNKDLPAKMMAHLRTIASEKILSQQSDKVSETGSQVVNLRRITVFETVSTQTWRVAIRAAALLISSDVTKVRLGYLPGDKLPGSALLPHVEWSVEQPAQPFFMAVTAPASILRPNVLIGTADKPNTDGAFAAGLTRKNTDQSLRYVSREQIDALFAHHFDQKPLAYEMSTRDKALTPSGMLMLPRQARQANSGTGAQTVSTVLAKLTATDPMTSVIGLAEMVRSAPTPEWKTPNPVAFMGAIFELAKIALDRCQRDNLLATKTLQEGPTGAALVDLHNGVCECVISKPDGEAFVLLKDGQRRKINTEQSASIIPSGTEVRKPEQEASAA